MRKSVGLVAALAIAASAFIGAPGASAATEDNIIGGGSSFAGGIITACATNFAAANPTAGTVTYTKNASQTGKDNFANGQYNFGGTDFIYSNTNGDNLPAGAKYVAVTSGPISFAYNLSTVTNLKMTPQLLAKIFKGDITTWNDSEILAIQVNTVKTALNRLASKTITPAYRTAGSGTSFNLSGYLAATTNNFTQSSDWSVATGDATPRGNAYTSSSNLKTGITANVGSIGYLDLKDATGLKVALLRNENNQYYAPDAKRSATFLNAQLSSAVKANGNVDIDWNKAVNGGYNATLITYAVVNTSGTTLTAKGATTKKFLQYVLNVCGPSVSYGLGYTPIQGAIRTKAYAVLNTVK
jgi:phosphate transport system substrate-binding protein